MNVYSVVCLETGEYDSLYSSAEKAIRALYRNYSSDADFGGISEEETLKKFKRTGHVDFPLLEWGGEIVKVIKIKVL